MEIRWSNIPVPEAHVLGLALGAGLQWLLGGSLFQERWIGHLLGWLLIAIGIALCLWSVLEARDMDVSSPNALLTSGPYAYSRNPMYVGWSLIYLGIAFVANSIWILALFPFVFAYIHFVDIRKEEKDLERKFGERYRKYKGEVRRYL